ncbi:Pre-rRNA-processing protein TSR2-domain-containing protein [Exophiala viscosa]|uniref:Pre-rRNA-processing protein TSR2-domain-containing protein n=1 Tax=Exophiala viscosa TaxID=2486360 RepID=A0AAN6I972_9EURO|nr:Pre-rRNA-processing protein TSR2-domain-containing protein [Exophiala viscosa]KAI1625379.1 Pre-rRNA-processing protein TSR2-domain-containing protein [Exophiala viscosa]
MAEVNSNGPQQAFSQITPGNISSQIDLLVALNLWSWPALTLAIQNAWGGSAQVSNDKRDWFAGAVSDLLTSTPPQLEDVGDLEEVLLQVMVDEFEIVVDDESAEEVARNIWAGLTKLKGGDASGLEELYSRWQEKQKKGGEKVVGIVRGEDKEAEDTDWDEDDDEGEEWNGFSDRADVDMDDAPPLVDASKPKQKLEPEVDDEGFTKVVGKKRR